MELSVIAVTRDVLQLEECVSHLTEMREEDLNIIVLG